MKRVTVTYTRETAETPWYWQISPVNALSSMHTFVEDNAGRMETYAYVTGNENIVTFTFNDQEIYDQFLALITSDVKTEYAQYCDDNNITIEVVTEDI